MELGKKSLVFYLYFKFKILYIKFIFNLHIYMHIYIVWSY